MLVQTSGVEMKLGSLSSVSSRYRSHSGQHLPGLVIQCSAFQLFYEGLDATKALSTYIVFFFNIGLHILNQGMAKRVDDLYEAKVVLDVY